MPGRASRPDTAEPNGGDSISEQTEQTEPITQVTAVAPVAPVAPVEDG